MGTIINSSLWSQLREPFEPRRVICFPSRFSLKGVDRTVFEVSVSARGGGLGLRWTRAGLPRRSRRCKKTVLIQNALKALRLHTNLTSFLCVCRSFHPLCLEGNDESPKPKQAAAHGLFSLFPAVLNHPWVGSSGRAKGAPFHPQRSR